MARAVTQLTAKHFKSWLRRQVRLHGRKTPVGYIGDHIDSPLEQWVKEELGLEEYFFIDSVDGFEYNGKQYFLSHGFEGLSICVLEGDSDFLPACGYEEITAWDMLQKVNEYLDDHLLLVA